MLIAVKTESVPDLVLAIWFNTAWMDFYLGANLQFGRGISPRNPWLATSLNVITLLLLWPIKVLKWLIWDIALLTTWLYEAVLYRSGTDIISLLVLLFLLLLLGRPSIQKSLKPCFHHGCALRCVTLSGERNRNTIGVHGGSHSSS